MLNQFDVQVLNRFHSSVELGFWIQVFKPLFALKGIMGYHYLLLSSFALENACYVGMMNDYGQCPMIIEHIAWLLLFGK